MTTEINVFFQGYFPMWGLTFDSDDVGVIEEQVVVYVPDEDEWRQVEKFDVYMERWRGSNPYSLDGPIPPTCLVTVARIQENEEFQEAFDRLADPMMAQMRDAILALRLLKEGWFLDPDFSEQIFSLVGFNGRLVGPYRQAFLGGLHDLIPPPYHLSIDELLSMGELATGGNRVTPLTTLWKLIRRYRDQGTHASADIAIENFHRSYGLSLLGKQRVAFLFTALDAILGGMSIREIGKIKLYRTFKDRVTVALETAAKTTAGVTIKPDDEANWLDTEGRRMRNAVAHGNPADVAAEAEKSYSRIRTIVRLILPQYLEFSIKWKSQGMQIRSQYGIAEDCGVTAAYNKVLDAHVRREAGAMDVLRPTNTAP